MKILVAVTGAFHGKLRVRRSSGTLDTEGLERVLSPGSNDALSLALQIKEETSAEITAVHLDRGWGEGVAREALASGADQAVLIEWSQEWDCDAGVRAATIADLYQQNGGYDLVIGPSESSFGGFSGALAAVAGSLQLPLATGARKLSMNDKKLRVVYGSIFGDYDVDFPLPAVVMAGDVEKRYATSWSIAAAYQSKGILRVRGDAYRIQKPRTRRQRIEEIRPAAVSSEEVDGGTLVRRLRSRSLIPEGSA